MSEDRYEVREQALRIAADLFRPTYGHPAKLNEIPLGSIYEAAKDVEHFLLYGTQRPAEPSSAPSDTLRRFVAAGRL